jgi:hypothetical protein
MDIRCPANFNFYFTKQDNTSSKLPFHTISTEVIRYPYRTRRENHFEIYSDSITWNSYNNDEADGFWLEIYIKIDKFLPNDLVWIKHDGSQQPSMLFFIDFNCDGHKSGIFSQFVRQHKKNKLDWNPNAFIPPRTKIHHSLRESNKID